MSKIFVLCAALLMFVGGLVLGVGCGATSTDERIGTETGNPPVIDVERIEVIATEGGVEVIGGPGAVPAEARVRVENTTTGERAHDTAADDGSFEVELGGTPADGFEISIEGSNPVKLNVTEVCLDEECRGASPDETQCLLGPQKVDAALREVADSIDASCQTHADCTRVRVDSECSSSFCHDNIPVARADHARVGERVTEIEAELCDPLQAAGCEIDLASCEPPNPWIPECSEGGCTKVQGCENIADWLAQRTAELANGVDASCTNDDDCYSVNLELTCNRSCALAAVSASGRDEFHALVAVFEQTMCEQFDASGCNPPEISCATVDSIPSCQTGRCSLQ